MSIDSNIAIMRRFFEEVWNQGRFEIVLQVVAKTSIGTGLGEHGRTIRGPDEYLDFVRRIRGAFSGIKLKVEDAFGTGDKVALRWSANMMHTGDDLGVLATGRPVATTGISIVRFENGKILESWDSWDQAAMMQQIGAVAPHSAVILENPKDGDRLP
jgi:steroid delta-isomerase-like uncharacterized protein